MLISLSLYYFSILLFGFVNSIVSYCVLLIINSLCCLVLIYNVSSFSWYALLFYIVYVGGVYVLFIFVSVYLPNSLGLNVVLTSYFFFAFFLLWEFISNSLSPVYLVTDESFNLCNSIEGFSYLFFCMLLVLSFFLVSLISSSKEGFIR